MKKISGIIAFFLAAAIPASAQAWNVDSVTWQDGENAVLIWDKSENTSYKIYRSHEKDGEYTFLGTTDTGSFRDNTAEYPETYYYKVERIMSGNDAGEMSEPVMSGTNPRAISSVSVIMYHNFVSEEDIKSGVEYEEYSIKPQDFEADLKWLRDNGYTTVTSDDLIEHLKGNRSLPQKAVIISIDDGSYGVYKNAWPLLKKYNMKADFNVIGRQIDDTWDKLHAGGTRQGEPAPYCTWEELCEMTESGEINLCSHTYGLHVYNKDKRVGMSMMENETAESFAEVVKNDYDLSVSCIEGWTGKAPKTVAYPYSKRSEESDRIILENTGYEILMAGDGARGTVGNYFVEGCDFENQLTTISRPCRMDGTPIGYYLARIEESDSKNGVNTPFDTHLLENAEEIARDYIIFDDVAGNEWFAGSVYYNYLNNLMKGVSYTEFAPTRTVSRSMAAALLYRLSGSPDTDLQGFSDTDASAWYSASVSWAHKNNILTGFDDGSFRPDATISRQELAQAMYRAAEFIGIDTNDGADITVFTDYKDILPQNTKAIRWAVANGIFRGSSDGTFNPDGTVTRAEMATVLKNWILKFSAN